MSRYRDRFLVQLVAAAIVAVVNVASAADLLSQIPQETLAFAVIRDLESVDTKSADLLRRLGVNLPRPLELIRQTTGIPAGLDLQGDVLIGVAVSPTDSANSYLYALVPCNDPTQFVSSLGGAADKPITAVTIAGVDVLAAPREKTVWLVDASQRGALELILAQPTSKSDFDEAWTQWATSNDATIFLTPAGIQEVVRRSMRSRSARQAGGPAGFGYEFGADRLWSILGRALRQEPKLREMMSQAKAVAGGIRIDEAHGPSMRFRLEPQPNSALTQLIQPTEPITMPMITLADKPFVFAAQTVVPPALWRTYGEAYVKRTLATMQRENATVFRPEDVVKFAQTVSEAAERVTAAMLLARSTEGSEAVFSNRFVLVKVDQAESFCDQVKQAMARWNDMADHAEGLLRMRFDSEEAEFGKRTGIEYTCDVAAAIGEEDVPALDSSMEKLFGDDGRLLIQVVPYDDETVLLANATRKQVASFVAALDADAKTINLPPDEILGDSLGTGMAARLFFDPHRYTLIRNREMEALVGGDVAIIGGPLVRPFPEATPIDVSAGYDSDGVWLEANIPWDTLEGLGDYVRGR